MKTRLVEVEKNDEFYINEVLKLEEEAFGADGGVDIWLLKPLIKYGKVLLMVNQHGEVEGVAEFIRDFSGKEVYLYGLAIKKEFRGRGKGLEFLELLKDYISKFEIDIISLTVSIDNIKALNLYKNAGFEKYDFLENEYGRGNDRVLMKFFYTYRK